MEIDAISKYDNALKQASSSSFGALISSRQSLLLVLFAGDHVSLSHIERRGVTVCV